ncbi:MAG TPA: hypothetical protein VK906_18040 [Egicoccus sp.]|nr:hypothetical protein [Egicoccus sp.]HSK25092.1 hypothetical protein [Egicoccus sp.]
MRRPSVSSLLLLLIAVLLAGCGMFSDVFTIGVDGEEPQPTSTPTDPGVEENSGEPEDPGVETPSGPPPAATPLPAPYTALGAETHPNAKTLASEIAQTLTTYEAGETLEEITARVASGERREHLAESVAGLYHPGAWSRGEVVYPQFGGLTADSTSVMVVLSQTIGEPGADGPRTEIRVIDVRLRLDEQAWVFDEIASDGGEPAERPEDLPPEAAAVLDDPRIELPDSARWDIHRGAVHPDLLAMMSRMADATGDLGVVVLESGHPYNVYGTERMSDHMRGRAVDLYRVAGELVIEGRASETSATHEAVQAIYDDPAGAVVGSPWALDEYGGRSFTDPVHLDHIHMAIRPPAEPDAAPEEDAPVDEDATDQTESAPDD